MPAEEKVGGKDLRARIGGAGQMLLMLVPRVSMIPSVRCIVIVLGRRALWCIENGVLQSGPNSNGRQYGLASP